MVARTAAPFSPDRSSRSGVYHWLNPTGANLDNTRRIELTSDDIRQIEIGWTAQWQRPPTPDELRNLVEERVREEILYREAIALGFDRGDTIVKRRMAQKMEFLSDNVSDLRELFNVGVEIGQIASITVVLALIALVRRIPLCVPRWAELIPPYAIGSLAMFWVVQRVAAF
jgi:hypothetical protein